MEGTEYQHKTPQNTRVKFTTDADCNLYIDGNFLGRIEAGASLSKNLLQGEYSILAISTVNKNVKYEFIKTIDKSLSEELVNVKLADEITDYKFSVQIKIVVHSSPEKYRNYPCCQWNSLFSKEYFDISDWDVNTEKFYTSSEERSQTTIEKQLKLKLKVGSNTISFKPHPTVGDGDIDCPYCHLGYKGDVQINVKSNSNNNFQIDLYRNKIEVRETL